MFNWKKQIIRDEKGDIVSVKRVIDKSRPVSKEDQEYYYKSHEESASKRFEKLYNYLRTMNQLLKDD